MVQTQNKRDATATDMAGGGGGMSLGKGAWDCDRNVEIPPEAEVHANQGLTSDVCGTASQHIQCATGDGRMYASYAPVGDHSQRNASRQLTTPRLAQAEVFEEIATMEFPFEGIPTIPPRKDMDHMVNSIIKEI